MLPVPDVEPELAVPAPDPVLPAADVDAWFPVFAVELGVLELAGDGFARFGTVDTLLRSTVPGSAGRLGGVGVAESAPAGMGSPQFTHTFGP